MKLFTSGDLKKSLTEPNFNLTTLSQSQQHSCTVLTEMEKVKIMKDEKKKKDKE